MARSHCEIKHKTTRQGEREYRYYRCSRYTASEHPRDRAPETVFDDAMLSVFTRLKIDDPALRDWLEQAIRAKMRDDVRDDTRRQEDARRNLDQLERDRETLLTMRLHGEIDADTFTRKDSDLRRQQAFLQRRADGGEVGKSRAGALALKLFELSQTLTYRWVGTNITQRRSLLELLCLNYTYDGVTLCPTMRKPFDILAEGLPGKTDTGGWN